jgi:hypothetical protein
MTPDISIVLEPCNRCCSSEGVFIEPETIQCQYCGFSESLEVWQLRGWRSIIKYPPTFSGTIFIYGKTIGRTIAKWDSVNKTCDNKEATHWLRTPDPTKQIGME